MLGVSRSDLLVHFWYGDPSCFFQPQSLSLVFRIHPSRCEMVVGLDGVLGVFLC